MRTKKEVVLFLEEAKQICPISDEMFDLAIDMIMQFEPKEGQGMLTGNRLEDLARFVHARTNLLPFLYAYAAQFEALHEKIPGGAPVATLWMGHLQHALREMQKELLPQFSKQEGS